MILTTLSTSLLAFGAGWWFVTGPLFWLLLIVGIVLLVRGRGGRPPCSRDRAAEIVGYQIDLGEIECFAEARCPRT